MVTAVSGHNARYVRYTMPLPQGLQYQAIWLEMQGEKVTPLTAAAQRGITFEKIAGRKSSPVS